MQDESASRPGQRDIDPLYNIPNASAVLVTDNNGCHDQHSANQTQTLVATDQNSVHSRNNGYATALVVGTEISPFSPQVSTATATFAEAVPLDPWSKTRTTSSALATYHGNASNQNRVYNTNGSSGDSNNPVPVVIISDPAEVSVEDEPFTPAMRRENERRHRLSAAMNEDPLHKKYRRRQRRRSRMVMGGATGFVLGTFVLGPFGAVVGLATGAALARTASKIGEKRKDSRVNRERERLLQVQMQQERMNHDDGGNIPFDLQNDRAGLCEG